MKVWDSVYIYFFFNSPNFLSPSSKQHWLHPCFFYLPLSVTMTHQPPRLVYVTAYLCVFIQYPQDFRMLLTLLKRGQNASFSLHFVLLGYFGNFGNHNLLTTNCLMRKCQNLKCHPWTNCLLIFRIGLSLRSDIKFFNIFIILHWFKGTIVIRYLCVMTTR